MNNDYIVGLMREIAAALPAGAERPDPEDMELGMPEAVLTTRVDVAPYVEHKRAAMVAHASQIGENSFFLQLPLDVFGRAFGYEWFIHKGVTPPISEDGLFGAFDE